MKMIALLFLAASLPAAPSAKNTTTRWPRRRYRLQAISLWRWACRIAGPTFSTTIRPKASWAYNGAAMATHSTSVRSLVSRWRPIWPKRWQALGDATTVPISPNQSRADAVRALQSFGKPASLLLTLREWKVDTMIGATLHYDVTMEAIAADGSVLAESRHAAKTT
ncbi:hypothetical protein [Methylogaea oryzae]|uniref:hypothetical protein n=1 Tax=Methylogaea oryzae TaxID=1295382 RepID=UPI0012E14106|nr:hypothetical protein [Methylogaea oryzae]